MMAVKAAGEYATVCPRDCYDTCFLKAHCADDGRLISISADPANPVTGRLLCPRSAKDAVRVYTGRVLYPHRRIGPAGTGHFKRITWDEAIRLVEEKLRSTLKARGPEAVLTLDYAGNTGLLSWNFPLRLWNAIGSARTDYAICSRSGHEALKLHYGSSSGLEPEDLLKCRSVIFWGFNAAASSPHIWRMAEKAKAKGAVIAVLDPRESDSARSADLHVKPFPGSDAALAYGIARSLIVNGQLDREFLDRYSTGFELFREEALTWPPERVEKETGVEQDLVEKLAEIYSHRKPGATMIGIGLQKSLYGYESVRAVSLLPALVGLYRHFFYSNDDGHGIDYPLINGETYMESSPKVVSQVDLSSRVHDGEFNFIYVTTMNPAASLPDQKAFRKGLEREDLFTVVHDTHWTATTAHADLVLPAATYLEKDDLVIPWSHYYLRKSEKAISPLGESRSELQVMQALAEALGLQQEWLSHDPWKVIEQEVSASLQGGDFSDLLKGKTLRIKKNRMEASQFPVNFASEIHDGRGVNKVPVCRVLPSEEGQFILITSAVANYTHTQFQEVYGPIPDAAHINTDDAAECGIREDDAVSLQNDRGKVILKAHLTEKQHRGVIWAPKLLSDKTGAPVNSLVSGAAQSLGGGSTFNSTMVRIKKESNEEEQ
ncbi:MAG: molybdopterin-dependent oxidoreductase [Candidatus Xenobiia bacterium LiM19]